MVCNINEHLFVQNNLCWVIDWNFLVNLEIHCFNLSLEEGVIWWKLDGITMLVSSQLVVNAHNDLVPIDIYMPLHEGHWLGQDIIACSNQVDVEDLMISYNTENSLVVVGSCLRIKFYDDTGLGVRPNGTLSF